MSKTNHRHDNPVLIARTVTFPEGQTMVCKGQGRARADAIEASVRWDGVYLSGRIASTGNLDYAWLSIPADAETLRRLAHALTVCADVIEGRDKA